MGYFCMEHSCFNKVSEKASWCDDCKAYMELEEQHEEGEYEWLNLKIELRK